MKSVQKISPFLWFDSEAEDAAKFYTSIFPNSRITSTTHYLEEGREIHGREPGSVMTVAFELDGMQFTAINGGPMFKFTEAISFQVTCENQAEIDHFWNALGDGGDPQAQQCGWLKDRFGLSWQVTPRQLEELMSIPDREKAGRVMNAMLQMKKIDIAELERAAEGDAVVR